MSRRNLNRLRKKLSPGFAFVLTLVMTGIAAAAFAYVQYISPTRVALVNYQGFQAAKIMNAEHVGWVRVDTFDEEDYSALRHYDFVMIFGRGLRLSEQALADIKKIARKRMVVVDAPMNPAHSINSVPDAHRATVTAYIDNAGETNYQNLLRYMRSTIQGKRIAAEAAEPPVDIAADVLFHLDPTAIFNSLADYRQYYRTTPGYSRHGRKIALLTSVPGPFNANRDHIDALILALEDEGYRVFPLASSTRRLQLMREIEPDLVVFMPHGRLHLGDSDEAINWLASQNMPVLSPLSVFDRYDNWMQDPQGYAGALLSMNVVLPELDGAVAPFVVNAQFQDANGSDIFRAVPDRLAQFIKLINGYITLKSTPNSEKRVGIVYFRGPGKNALTAGNLEVAESLYNTLLSLRAQGYTLDGLPASFTEFKTRLDRQGTVMTPRAPGQSRQFLSEADPAFIPDTSLGTVPRE